MSDSVYFHSEYGDEGVPSKGHTTDAGYDVTVFRVHKRESALVTLYDTGIRLRPHEEDVYFELVARSSLHKRGYMLVNNVGIIDNGYRGPILVALYKFSKEAPELELPARVAQLIPKRTTHVTFVHDTKFLTRKRPRIRTPGERERGEGGFGSTDQKGEEKGKEEEEEENE